MKPYYSEDGITIYHGDCREILPSVQADAVVTDPPYGISANRMTLGAGKKTFERGGDWDSERVDLSSLLQIGTAHGIWGGNYYTDLLKPTNQWMIWHKVNDGRSFSECEMCWTDFSGNIKHLSHHWSGEDKQHPTQKPFPLMRWCLSFLPEICTSILDPFMGSGTTLRAAKDLGRKAIGIEIEEKYCEIAAKRLSQRVLEFQ